MANIKSTSLISTHEINLNAKLNIVKDFLTKNGYPFFDSSSDYDSGFSVLPTDTILQLYDKEISIESVTLRNSNTGFEQKSAIAICIDCHFNDKIILDEEGGKLIQALREAFMYLELNGLIKTSHIRPKSNEYSKQYKLV